MSAQRSERADAQRNRQKVLETADRLLAERGTSVTLGEIAAAAGVGAGTVYRHFPTKDALMATVLDHRTEQLTAWGRAVRAELEPGEAFFAFLRHVAEHAFANRVICESLASRGDWQQPLKIEGRCMIDSPLAELLRDAQRVGAIRGDLEPEDARAMMLGFVAMAQALDSPERAGLLAEVMWDGLRPESRRNHEFNNETWDDATPRDETGRPRGDESGHRCAVCGDPIAAAGTGRPPKYCSPACRQRAFRAKQKAAAEAAAR
ncbi:TetR/AcrR family transcriptional regulator [Glycomyces tarimensis]